MNKLRERQFKRIYDILMHKNIPNENKMFVIKRLMQNSSFLFGAINVFNYGYIEGVRHERDLRKHSKVVILSKVRIFYDKFGRLPNTLEELNQWINNRGETNHEHA